jgi:hypothetical protein
MPCCNDEAHIDNFDTSGYDNILRSGQGAVKEALEKALAGCNSKSFTSTHTWCLVRGLYASLQRWGASQSGARRRESI